jgi:Na+/melibiose symporter-like transporter
MTLAMALGMPVWLRVMRRMEKHRAWSLAAAGMMAALLAVTVLEPGPGALRLMIAIMAVFGFFLGCSSIALPSLLADVVDYDVWRNRQDRAAILFSFQAVVTKLNQGVGGAVALAIPVWFGFSPQEPAAKAAELGLKAAFVAWPCCAAGVDAGARVALPAGASLAWHSCAPAGAAAGCGSFSGSRAARTPRSSRRDADEST